MATHSCFRLENPMDRGALQATVHGTAKSWTRLSNFTLTCMGFPGGSVGKKLVCNAGDVSLGQEDPLEEGMANHSSILPWKIPWTEEPCRLQSMGSQRVGQD